MKTRTFTGHLDVNGDAIYDGDVLGQNCNMVDDYTGAQSVEVQKLIVRFDERKQIWSVYCPTAPSQDNWGYIPKSAYKL